VHFDLSRETLLCSQAPAVFSEDADRVRFVQKEHCAEPLFQVDQLLQRNPISIHLEDRLGHDEDAPARMFALRPFQVALELAQMVVWKNAQDCSAQPGAVNEGRVG
jgi:hypothetical protein